MELNEQKNIDAIHAFLANNNIDQNSLNGYNCKLTIFYYVGESRKFAEETRLVFNILGDKTIVISLNEINYIEFETEFKTTENIFTYDEDSETLTIIGNNSNKHNQDYKIVINSIYLD